MYMDEQMTGRIKDEQMDEWIKDDYMNEQIKGRLKGLRMIR